jgi:hypothetical protein
MRMCFLESIVCACNILTTIEVQAEDSPAGGGKVQVGPSSTPIGPTLQLSLVSGRRRFVASQLYVSLREYL